MAAAAQGSTWKPYDSLTVAPTNLKEAIDWVLRVTGRDGKKNDKVDPTKFGCLCFLAKAMKDLLYDAKDPGSPGPSPKRYWDDILLPGEQFIVKPVLTDLGLVKSDSTTSTTSTFAGGTEVIKALIGQLAQGLQKWVGWQDRGDECCLKGDKGIGGKCTCNGGVSTGCCGTGGPSASTCHDCGQCGTTSAKSKCYLSAYCKTKSSSSSASGSPEGDYYWSTISSDSTKVHLLARIFLGSVCLIWSGLSQLGFLTGGSGGKETRWKESKLHDIEGATAGLGSFMAAMGYDLDRLNQGKGTGKTGSDVWKLLSGQDDKKSIQWNEFTNGASQGSVAEYYSSIYGAVKETKTETLCKQYPLLVLHILASGYFRAGSAGANKIPVTPPKATTKKEETPSSRKPRTIREILYWLSALPYSQGYKTLVERMQQKTDQVTNKQDSLKLEGDSADKKTDLRKDCITHYLMAACGYCPLVLIGIQGTIATSGSDSDTAQGSGGNSNGNNQGGSPNQNNGQSNKNKCPNHSKDRNRRCDPKNIKEQDVQVPSAPASPSSNGELQPGQVCYGGYHLEVSQFGPLHGMYANGLFGFEMGGSAAQCLDQLRVYVYHCFYQLYFLRKQCGVGVVGGAGAKTVLGWQSCRYGKEVRFTSTNDWRCTADAQGSSGNDKCKCKTTPSPSSPLMSFLCDSPGALVCGVTVGSGVDKYPPIEDHMENKQVVGPKHFGGPPKHCPVPMGWQSEASTTGSSNKSVNHFKDLNNGSHKQESLNQAGKYPAHCTGNTLSLLLEYYCDPEKCQSGTLVVLLRLLACITPTVPRTLGDLFGFYYYIVYIGGKSNGNKAVSGALGKELQDVRLGMNSSSHLYSVVGALQWWNGDGSSVGGGACSHSTTEGSLKTLFGCNSAAGTGKCCPYLSPLSGQQYGQLSPAMPGTYLSWLVYLIEGFNTGLSQPWYCLLHYPFQVMTEQDQQLSLRAHKSQ